MVALEKHVEVAMPDALLEVLNRIRFGTAEDQASGALTLALLLEYNSRGLNLESYRLVLPEDLLVLRLTRDEEYELTVTLRDLYLFEVSHPSILWALGKARAANGLGPLLEILEERCETLDEEASHQMLTAFGDLLLTASEHDLLPLTRCDPRPWIARLSSRHPGRVRENGRRLLWDLGSCCEAYN